MKLIRKEAVLLESCTATKHGDRVHKPFKKVKGNEVQPTASFLGARVVDLCNSLDNTALSADDI